VKYLWRELRCRLFGHPDTVIVWGRVRAYPGERSVRDVAEVCDRCRQVVGTATLIRQGERWTA
jgi:hypothetical protein